MPLAAQAKILRCIQEKAIEPVGSNTTQKVDVRIIAATNQNLVEAIEKGSSAAICITGSTSTRSSCRRSGRRKEDIPSSPSTSPSARQPGRWAKSGDVHGGGPLRSSRTTWPGNIRERRNCIERLTIMRPGTAITPERLASLRRARRRGRSRPSALAPPPARFDRQLAETERDSILRALRRNRGGASQGGNCLAFPRAEHVETASKKLGINIIKIKKEMI